LILVLSGCSKPDGANKEGGSSKPGRQVIQSTGSDTMVNLAQEWAEAYHKVNADVTVEVAGGGSGVGISSLTQGITDIANSSRDMTKAEKEQAKQKTGKEVIEFTAGYDGIAIYVHKDNPIRELTMEQLADIFGENGKIEKWSQLGIQLPNDEIVRVSRQNSSGTYVYFREHVLQKKDFKLGSRDMSGSKDVVELVGHTVGAIGYSGMGYKTNAVRFVKIAPKAGDPVCEPNLENVRGKKYPLARALFLYTLGEPTGELKKYLDWVLSPDGQKIVEHAGYVPVTTDDVKK
jgi:phosphate transport system substrate-binding protein